MVKQSSQRSMFDAEYHFQELVGDTEAQRRARLDLGWKVALGVEVAAAPFAQSTLQHCRHWNHRNMD